MMTRKENLLAALSGQKTDYVPLYFTEVKRTSPGPMHEFQPRGVPAGLDGFGVHWTATASAFGASTPTPGIPPVLEEIEDWKSMVKFSYEPQAVWAEAAEREKAAIGYTPDLVFECLSPNGIFERLHFLMGFENALCAIVTEPEAVGELLDALAEWKIYQVENIAKHYKPDYFTLFDDYAHMSGLLISPQTFRDLFKPRLKKIVDATHSFGLKYKQHCCGKMEALLDDFLEIGVDAIDPVQPCNDIVAMKGKTLGKVGIIGGLDLQGVVDRDDVTEEQLRAEVRRCIDTYGPDGYAIYGASLHMFTPAQYAPGGRINILADECMRYQNVLR